MAAHTIGTFICRSLVVNSTEAEFGEGRGGGGLDISESNCVGNKSVRKGGSACARTHWTG